MSRYVDVEPLDVVGTKGVSKDYVDGMAYVLDLLDNLPIVDVEPVRHGQWVDRTQEPGWPDAECSVCGSHAGMFWMNYCPYCGAKMDEKEQEHK